MTNPPFRTAPRPTPTDTGARQGGVLGLAAVLLVVVAGVLFAMQATWGELWWKWPRGWFNTPRLIAYGSVLAAIAIYAVVGRLITRGGAYIAGLVLLTLGTVFVAFVWFIASLFTGLGL